MNVVESYRSELSEEQQARNCWARAVEWEMWPAFLGQSVIPLLYVWVGWKFALIGVLTANLVWNAVFSTAIVSLPLAVYGALLTKFIKWPVIIGVSVFFCLQSRWGMAVLTLLTPLVATLVGMVRLRSKEKLITEFFMLQVGRIPVEPSPEVQRYVARRQSGR